MSDINAEIARLVRSRAEDRCEFQTDTARYAIKSIISERANMMEHRMKVICVSVVMSATDLRVAINLAMIL